MSDKESPTLRCLFMLGRPHSEEHLQKLAEVAGWLEQNKFSCTFSMREGVAFFEIEPWDKNDWPEENKFSGVEFYLYASEIVIHSLAKKIGEPS